MTGSNKVWRKFTFSPITTSKIRVTITALPDSWSRVVEIQAFGTSAGGEKVQWLVPDHLGTPRIIIDQTGSRANVKRLDYLPFGEGLYAGTGGRTIYTEKPLDLARKARFLMDWDKYHPIVKLLEALGATNENGEVENESKAVELRARARRQPRSNGWAK